MVRTRLLFVLFVALILHQSFFASFRVLGVRVDVMLLVAVAAGLVGGSERGAMVGFAAGLLADLFVRTPFGLSALTFSLVGFAVGGLQSGLIRSAWWISPLIALVASAVGVFLYGVLGALIGQSFVGPGTVRIAAGVAAVNALLAVPAVRFVHWALPSAPEPSFAR